MTAEEAGPAIEVWTRFRRAVTEHDGPTAADELSADSVALWNDVLRGSRDPVESRFMEVSVRLLSALARRFSSERERAIIGGRELFILAVEQGWALPMEITSVIGLDVVCVARHEESANVCLGDDSCSVVAILDGNRDRWWVRFSSLLYELESDATNAATAAGVSEDQYIDSLARRIGDRILGQ